MSTVARVRLRRAIARVCLAVLGLALAGLLCFLPFAGRFLVREDPLDAADAIFVLAGARVERWLEGYELYRERRAPLIVLSPGPTSQAEIDLRARGIRFPSEGDIARDALLQLGVPAEAIRLLPRAVDNTAQEAGGLHDMSRHETWRRIIVVTSAYHTRRARFAFRREFKDSSIQIAVRASRFDGSEPARWWRHRPDIRFVTSELQKLALYGLGLGG
jgi:uncharacterized SAM-binding protein YcdF (DUF218 family)